jgi:glutamyl/glutaminyl-tRNA synthetase
LCKYIYPYKLHHYALQSEMTRMIKEKKAYCDCTEKLEMRDMRAEGKESTYRSNSVEENLRCWEEMKKGK